MLKSEFDFWKAHEYEKRLELSLTEKERNDAANLIISMFRQRLEDGSRLSKVSQ